MKRVAIAVLLLSVLPMSGQKPPALKDEVRLILTPNRLREAFAVRPGQGSNPKWSGGEVVVVVPREARPCSIPLLTFKPKIKGYIKEFTPPESGHKIRKIEPPAPPCENWSPKP